MPVKHNRVGKAGSETVHWTIRTGLNADPIRAYPRDLRRDFYF